jgi:predicted lipid-binding transport protein (Tim44 family)
MSEIDLPTVLFALVALFVAFKLRSVLGTRNGGERRPGGLMAPLRRAPSAPPQDAPPASAPLPPPASPAAAEGWKAVAASDAWSGLDAIAAADRGGFDGQAFVSGARAAYEMVVNAFAAGDGATLLNLMAPEAFANFDAAIRARAAAGQTMTTTVVSIDDARIVTAHLDGSTAQIGVRYASKLASVTRDRAGTVVDGSPTEVTDHLDLWTFVRDVRSRDPNWRLTATQTER